MSLIVPVEFQVFLGIINNYIIKLNCSKTLLKSFVVIHSIILVPCSIQLLIFYIMLYSFFTTCVLFLSASSFAVYMKLYFQTCCMYILLFISNCIIFALYCIYVG